MDLVAILIRLIVPLLIVGLFLWAINYLGVIDERVRRVITVVAVVVMCVWLLYTFVPGAWGPAPRWPR